MPEILWPVQPRTNRTFGIIDAVTFTLKTITKGFYPAIAFFFDRFLLQQ
jgi:hypothetical protein